MIYMFAERRQHADTWCRLNDVDPRKVKLIDRPQDIDGLDTQVVILYHTFWRRLDAQMLYDYARARRLVIATAPERSSAD